MTPYSLDEMNSGQMFAQVLYLGLQRYHEATKSQLKDATSKFIGTNEPCYVKTNSNSDEEYWHEISSVKIGESGKKVALADIHRVIFDGPLSFQGEGCHELGYFDRRYKHVGDNTIHMVWEPKKGADDNGSEDDVMDMWNRSEDSEQEATPVERVQSCEPDLAVCG